MRKRRWRQWAWPVFVVAIMLVGVSGVCCCAMGGVYGVVGEFEMRGLRLRTAIHWFLVKDRG
jgi:hypothetical protein